MGTCCNHSAPKSSCIDRRRLIIFGTKLKAWVIENFLPLSFAVALIFALAYPVPGKFLASVEVAGIHICQEICIVIVFFISGLVLNTTELKRALRRESILTILYGFLAILVWTPCLGFAMREIPLEPKAFTIGLTIFTVAPTTLGVGLALVRSCKGNEAVALLLTVATNMLGVFTMPLELRLLFAGYDTGDLDLTFSIPGLLAKLSVIVLAPSLVGKALRELWKPAEKFAKDYRAELSMFSTVNLAFVVWQTLSSARDTLFKQNGGMIAAVIALGAGVHVFYLVVNWLVIWFGLKPPIKEAVCVIIMASQKSAPAAVAVILNVTKDTTQQGLLAIPAIVAQLSQIFIGAALAKWIAPKVDADMARQKEEEALAAAAQAALELQPTGSSDGIKATPSSSNKQPGQGLGVDATIDVEMAGQHVAHNEDALPLQGGADGTPLCMHAPVEEGSSGGPDAATGDKGAALQGATALSAGRGPSPAAAEHQRQRDGEIAAVASHSLQGTAAAATAGLRPSLGIASAAALEGRVAG